MHHMWLHLLAKHRRSATVGLFFGMVLLTAACTSSTLPTHASDAGVTANPEQCALLAGLSGNALGEPSARIASVTFSPPSPPKTIPGAPPWMAVPALPEHCEVNGVMRERTGTDGQAYAVRFRVRLPTAWNGRYLYEGGGGTNGQLGNTVGNPPGGGANALDRGFAVVSTDTGHDNATNSNPARQGPVAFGHDYEARLEYSEKALKSVAAAGERIVAAYYGRPAEYNYFAGCSNGGREGMVFAQRFPDQFSGILAGAPAFAVPKAAIAEAWDTQAFAALADKAGLTAANGLPDLAMTFSEADLALVGDAVLEACDAADGLADGMVQRLDYCTTKVVEPVLRGKQCNAPKANGCLSSNQVDTLIRSLGGPRDSAGNALYADWPWDAGIAAEPWRMWKIGVPGGMPAINVTLGAAALSGLFMTPPETVAGSPEAGLKFQMTFDFDRDAPRIFATTPEFPRSAWDLVGAQDTDLSAFREQGGKMIVPHGGSDPIFSLNDTTAWWRTVNEAEQGEAGDFVRVFPVPGQTHCVLGPATGNYDALGALVTWVEKGVAPDRIEATAGPDTPWPGRTRPLCPYPSYADYGSGDPERAASFSCRLPMRATGR